MSLLNPKKSDFISKKDLNDDEKLFYEKLYNTSGYMLSLIERCTPDECNTYKRAIELALINYGRIQTNQNDEFIKKIFRTDYFSEKLKLYYSRKRCWPLRPGMLSKETYIKYIGQFAKVGQYHWFGRRRHEIMEEFVKVYVDHSKEIDFEFLLEAVKEYPEMTPKIFSSLSKKRIHKKYDFTFSAERKTRLWHTYAKTAIAKKFPHVNDMIRKVPQACLTQEFVEEMVSSSPSVIKSWRIMNSYKPYFNEDMCKTVLESSGALIQYLPRDMITRELCELAIKTTPSAIQFIPSSFRDNRMALKASFKVKTAKRYIKTR